MNQTQDWMIDNGRLDNLNKFLHVKSFPRPVDKEVVRPNCDTLYSLAWLDLGKDGVIVSLPNTDGRYYVMQVMDAWTNTFESFGKRTTGTGPQSYFFTGPFWQGPEEVEGATTVKSPTNLIAIVLRIQVDGPEDVPNVNLLQEQIVIREYYGGVRDNFLDPDWTRVPVEEVEVMTAETFITTLVRLLKYNPPSPDDTNMVESLKDIGINLNNLDSFDYSKLNILQRWTLSGAQTLALKIIKSKQGWQEPVNGWVVQRDIGTYGIKYGLRATIAYYGLGANLPVDALYPSSFQEADGTVLDGRNKYLLHFESDQIPQAYAFWSLTMYNKESFLVENPINKYVIRDRDQDLKYNDDGSLDIYIQNESPGQDKESNWLPAPNDRFSVTMRLYWPKEEALKDDWFPAPIKKVE